MLQMPMVQHLNLRGHDVQLLGERFAHAFKRDPALRADLVGLGQVVHEV